MFLNYLLPQYPHMASTARLGYSLTKATKSTCLKLGKANGHR